MVVRYIRLSTSAFAFASRWFSWFARFTHVLSHLVYVRCCHALRLHAPFAFAAVPATVYNTTHIAFTFVVITPFCIVYLGSHLHATRTWFTHSFLVQHRFTQVIAISPLASSHAVRGCVWFTTVHGLLYVFIRGWVRYVVRFPISFLSAFVCGCVFTFHASLRIMYGCVRLLVHRTPRILTPHAHALSFSSRFYLTFARCTLTFFVRSHAARGRVCTRLHSAFTARWFTILRLPRLGLAYFFTASFSRLAPRSGLPVLCGLFARFLSLVHRTHGSGYLFHVRFAFTHADRSFSFQNTRFSFTFRSVCLSFGSPRAFFHGSRAPFCTRSFSAFTHAYLTVHLCQFYLAVRLCPFTKFTFL